MSQPSGEPRQPCPILLINLDRSRGRFESACRQLAAAGLVAERLEAVDGRLLPEAELRRLAPWSRGAFFKPLSPGEVGCYLSHIAAAERIVREAWPVALVLEDDFSADPSLAVSLAELVALGDALPDLVRLDGEMRGGEVVTLLPGGARLLRHRRPPIRTTSLLWTLGGARRFLAVARPLRRPVDVQLKHWWEGGLSVLALDPPVVSPDAEQSARSTIGERRSRSLGERLRRLDYRCRYAVRCQWELLVRRGFRSWLRANLG